MYKSSCQASAYYAPQRRFTSGASCIPHSLFVGCLGGLTGLCLASCRCLCIIHSWNPYSWSLCVHVVVSSPRNTSFMPLLYGNPSHSLRGSLPLNSVKLLVGPLFGYRRTYWKTSYCLLLLQQAPMSCWLLPSPCHVDPGISNSDASSHIAHHHDFNLMNEHNILIRKWDYQIQKFFRKCSASSHIAYHHHFNLTDGYSIARQKQKGIEIITKVCN